VARAASGHLSNPADVEQPLVPDVTGVVDGLQGSDEVAELVKLDLEGQRRRQHVSIPHEGHGVNVAPVCPDDDPGDDAADDRARSQRVPALAVN
jgi:hypothetical protein